LGQQALELVEGAVVAALEAGLVAGEIEQRVEFTDSEAVDISEALGGVAGSYCRIVAAGKAVHFRVEVGGFGGADAAETPHGGKHLLDLEGFGRGAGLVFVEEFGAESFESRAILDGEEKVVAGEAVLDGVIACGGFAGFGFRAGAFAVSVVGLDLVQGCHGCRSPGLGV
jgi:hypothetical protein